MQGTFDMPKYGWWGPCSRRSGGKGIVAASQDPDFGKPAEHSV